MADRRVSVQVDADVSPFVRGLTEAGAAAKGFSAELESADSKMSTLVQAGLALAPALVPLGAAAVPAIAGLATQLGFAVAAAGTAVLAFQGVGGALKALNDYQIAPTAEHFKKLQEAMDALGPKGQEFVLALQKMRPELQKLQDVAQAGMFPGLTEGLKSLTTLGPEAERIIGIISSEMGNLAAQAGADIAGPRWQSFFSFLDREATPTLAAMGHTLGNVVHGLSQMVMAFSPLADSFTQGMVTMSAAFDHWASGLSGSAGFQHFVDYVRTSGPEAMHALGAVADALVALVQAAAPVGQVVLPIVADIAHVFAAIARSDIGTPLIAAAAAFATLSKAAGLLGSTGIFSGGQKGLGKTFAQAIAPMREFTSATAELKVAEDEMAAAAIRARDAQFALVPTAAKRAALQDYASAQNKVAVASAKVTEAEQKRSASFRETAATIGKGAALVGAFAIAQSGVADKMGLSNTATLALAGTLAGPWGAAAGAAVGLTMDLAAANNDVEAAMKRAGAAAKQQAIDFSSQHTAVASLQASTDAYFQAIQSKTPTGALKSFADLFTHTSEESRRYTQQQTADFLALRQGAGEFYAALNHGDLSGLQMTDAQLTQFTSEIAPALEKAGLNLRDVLLSHKGWDEAVRAVSAYNSTMDSATGKSASVGKAMADLASQMESNVTQADALKNALDALFGVQLSQSAATDAWAKGLQDLRANIAKTNGAINGNSKAALDNRSAIRDSVQALQDKISADAKAGVSGDKLVGTLLRGRKAIEDQAVAAGASRGKVQAYLDTLGLTPKNLKTIIMTPGLLTAKQEIQALGRLYGLTPKQVRTLISQPGIGDSKAQIDALAKKYNLTPKEVRTFLRAIDQASGPIANVRAALDRLNGQVANTTIRTNHYDFYTGGAPNRSPGKPSADGSTVPKDGGPYGDRYPYLLAPGEEVISNRHGQADRHRALLKAINAGMLADGGTVGVWRGLAGGGTIKSDPAMAKLAEEIRGLRIELAKQGKGALTGHDRRMKEIDLRQKEQDLRDKHQKARADRLNALQQKLSGLRSAVGGFHPVQDTPGWQPRNPILTAIGGDLASFRKSIRDAGGEWSKQMQHMGDRLRHEALAIDVHERALDRETKKRDELTQSLDDQKQALADLQSTMSSYSQSVAGNFLGSPFGQSQTITVPGSVDPALQARLDAAKGQLSALRNSPTGDSVAAGAAASRLIPQIADLQAQVDQMAQPVEKTVSGLDLMREQLKQNTADALAFADALKTLSADGLNSDLFQQLAASGDLNTAQQLAAGGQSAVDDINALWNQRAEAAAQVAAYATQQVYGQQQAILEAKLAQTNAQLATANGHIKALQGEVRAISGHVEHIGDRIVAAVHQQEAAVAGAIHNLPRAQTRQSRRG